MIPRLNDYFPIKESPIISLHLLTLVIIFGSNFPQGTFMIKKHNNFSVNKNNRKIYCQKNKQISVSKRTNLIIHYSLKS